MTHTVSVAASSLYEAAALAVAEFKKSGFALAGVGPGTRLKVEVEAPTTAHELSVGRCRRGWIPAGNRLASRLSRLLCGSFWGAGRPGQARRGAGSYGQMRLEANLWRQGASCRQEEL